MSRQKRSIHCNFETLRVAVRAAQGKHSYFRMGYGALEQLATRPWQRVSYESR